MTAGATISRVAALDRRYLTGTFADLCRIESPSGRERACAERVIAELEALGLSVDEDGAGAAAGSDCGNLLVRLPGAPGAAGASAQALGGLRGATGAEAVAGTEQHPTAEAGAAAERASGRRSILLCAHLDTVPALAPIEPVVVDGFFENANEGILGADNKAAVAVLLALARHVRRAGSPVDVELLFTVGEELALAGARAFDVSRLQSDFGYVFDHASPIGEVIVGSPSHFRIEVGFLGAAAHAGIRPEDGRSAVLAAARAVASMPLGRLDEDTTANVGTIAGGSALNVVPERCSLLAEVRSLDDRRAESVVSEIVDRVHEAANLPDCDCDVDVSVQRTFSGYRLRGGDPALEVAEAALRECGYEPARVRSGGGSDANALIAGGFATVNLANGTERNHEPGERVSVAALEGMLDVALALLDQAAALPADAAL